MDPLYGSGTEDPLHGNDTLSLCGVLDSCSEISVNKILIYTMAAQNIEMFLVIDFDVVCYGGIEVC